MLSIEMQDYDYYYYVLYNFDYCSVYLSIKMLKMFPQKTREVETMLG